MANNFSARTWIIDTAGTTSKYTGPVYIGRISWHPTAAGQSLVVEDGRGNIQWQVTSVAAGNDASSGIEDWPNPEHKMPWDGFYVPTMTAGILYVTVL
jgi:hypothetical protein